LSTEPPVILDADFLSSFAWINRLDILENLYSKRMIVLEEVLEELRRVPHLASRVELSIRNGHIRSEAMFADSPEALHNPSPESSVFTACTAKASRSL
jgi:predicted nucleic acid-binding protein